MQPFDFKSLIGLSRWAGQRFDLVQAGGGNSSEKLVDGSLYVKASGLTLADVSVAEDFCHLDWRPLVEFLNTQNDLTDIDHRQLEPTSQEIIRQCNRTPEIRPSIEALLHCALGPVTLHTHPISAAVFLCRANWRQELEKLFPQAFFIEYTTPGAGLAVRIHQALSKRGWRSGSEAIVFLQNHGLIVAAATAESVRAITDDVIRRSNAYLGLAMPDYWLTDLIAPLLEHCCQENSAVYLTQDRYILDVAATDPALILSKPTIPDQMVYCGPEGLQLDIDDNESLAPEA